MTLNNAVYILQSTGNGTKFLRVKHEPRDQNPRPGWFFPLIQSLCFVTWARASLKLQFFPSTRLAVDPSWNPDL